MRIILSVSAKSDDRVDIFPSINCEVSENRLRDGMSNGLADKKSSF